MPYKRKLYEEIVKENSDLKRQLFDMQNVAQRQKVSEEALKLDEARLEALLRLSQLRDASEQDIADFALEECIRLTDSDVGWMGALDYEKGLVNLYNYSIKTREECGVPGIPHSYVIEGGGLWAEPIKKRKPVLINDYGAPNEAKKGFPEGHLQLNNFLAVPVFDGDIVVAMAEVGNKKGDYDHSDARQLTLLMDGVWRIIMRKRAEIAQQESKKRAEMYLDLMSHDISNINQIALGFLEIALEKFEKGDLQEKENRFIIERPVEALRSSSKLIGNVKKLQYAKKGGLKSRLFDLNAVLEEVISEYAIIPGRDVKIEYTPEIGFFILANELIKDVFSNIVGNAVKHSPADKPLMIKIRIFRVTEQGHNYNVVMVEDNGPGIPDTKKGLLFDRYSSAPDKRQKGGLGLELVNTLVSDFKGMVWIEDRIAGDHSQGSRFIVKLPAAEI